MLSELDKNNLRFAVRACMYKGRSLSITKAVIFRNYGWSEENETLVEQYYKEGLKEDILTMI